MPRNLTGRITNPAPQAREGFLEMAAWELRPQDTQPLAKPRDVTVGGTAHRRQGRANAEGPTGVKRKDVEKQELTYPSSCSSVSLCKTGKSEETNFPVFHKGV